MKLLMTVCIVCLGLNAFSQNPEIEVRKAVETFFMGFHQQDSTIIKQVVSKDLILQSIGKDKDGNTFVRNEDFNQFLISIVSIPKDQKFEEKLLSFNIQIDGNMANVWTPYEFWFNGEFSHCGVNSFQLVQLDNVWKIIYLIDTRRKTGCEN